MGLDVRPSRHGLKVSAAQQKALAELQGNRRGYGSFWISWVSFVVTPV